jgi:hypothetical protein
MVVAVIDDAILRAARDAAKAQRMMRLPAGTSEALAHADRVNDQMAAALALLADRHLAPLGAAA